MKSRIICMKFVAVISMGMLCVACGGSSKSDSSNASYTNAAYPTSEPNYHKAALLNVEMGEQYLKQGNISRAKTKFLHALELKPKLPEVHAGLGYFYETVGDMPYAEEHYRKAIDLGKGAGRYHNAYGTFLCREKRYQEADKAFLSAIADKQYIRTAETYENAGLCARRSGRLDKADEYFQLAVRRDPRQAVAVLEIAEMAYNREDYQQARSYLQTYKIHNDPSPRSLWLSIQTNRKLGYDEKVANDVLLLKSLFEESQEYKFYLQSVAHG